MSAFKGNGMFKRQAMTFVCDIFKRYIPSYLSLRLDGDDYDLKLIVIMSEESYLMDVILYGKEFQDVVEIINEVFDLACQPSYISNFERIDVESVLS